MRDRALCIPPASHRLHGTMGFRWAQERIQELSGRHFLGLVRLAENVLILLLSYVVVAYSRSDATLDGNDRCTIMEA